MAKLVDRRNQLATQVTEVEREIKELEDSPLVAAATPSPDRNRTQAARVALPRPKISLSFADAIAAELEPGEVVNPADIARSVLRNGYQTAAKQFPLLATGTLRRDQQFRRVQRGQYEIVT